MTVTPPAWARMEYKVAIRQTGARMEDRGLGERLGQRGKVSPSFTATLEASC